MQRIISMIDKLRIAVLTQEDSFVIPKNIRLLGNLEQVKLVAVAKIDAKAKGSIVGKKCFFAGFWSDTNIGVME